MCNELLGLAISKIADVYPMELEAASEMTDSDIKNWFETTWGMMGAYSPKQIREAVQEELELRDELKKACC